MRDIRLVMLLLLLPMLGLAVGKPAAGVHVVVDCGTWRIFGGTDNGKWVSDEEMGPKVKGGERYRLYTLTGFLGEGIGEKAVIEESGPALNSPNVYIDTKVKFPDHESVIAVNGAWDALPRVPKVQSTKQSAYEKVVRETLNQHGLTGATVNITQIIRIDLEGDGQEEVLICARTPRKHFPDINLEKNDYSVVLLRKIVKDKVVTIPIEGEFWSPKEPINGPSQYDISAVLDVNGDGVMEVILAWGYYEGDGKTIYTIDGTKSEAVLTGGSGA